jgi:hypothetical protein
MKKDVLKKDHKEDIELWEDNPDLMGDLTSLWKANEGNENSFENMNHIWKNFELFYNCYDKEKSKKNPELSNWVRLYRVLIEDGRLGGIYYCKGMKGAWFSRRSTNYLNNNDFMSLCQLKSDNLINELKYKVKKRIPKTDTKINDNNFSTESHLKLWLLIKVLNAQNKLLSFYDGRSTENGEGNGLASYDEYSKNKLNSNLPFTLGNSICGYAVKRFSYIEYTDNSWWGDPIAFDTVIGDTISFDAFNDRNKVPISPEKVAEMDAIIQKLLDEFYLCKSSSPAQ